MTRIVAGAWRGRRLAVPATGARPTSERVREALFNTMDHELGGFAGVAVLDLYAGSGALALEALSRGAQRALLVESDRGAAVTAERNAAALGTADAVVWCLPAQRLPQRRPPGGPFGLVLADPPYDAPAAQVAGVLGGLLAAGWLAPGAMVVVERPRRDAAPPWPAGVAGRRQRRYGDTVVWYGRAAGPPTGAERGG